MFGQMSNEKEEESWDQGHKNEFYLPHFKQQLYIHSLEKLKGSTNLFSCTFAVS